MQNSSLNFDRAADIYDATRSLPPQVARALADLLEREVREAGGRLLEVGVGTGRITRPLAARGVRVCGLDISRRMMDKLREQVGAGDVAPDLILSDATRVPFAGGAFSAVIASHVLHLVSSWKTALEEIRRVLRPGGIFINTWRDYPDGSPYTPHADKWEELLARRGLRRGRRGPDSEEFASVLSALGARARMEKAAEWEATEDLETLLQETRNRIHSWSWELPDEVFETCYKEYEPWARQTLPERAVCYQVQQVEIWTFAGRGR